MDNGPLDAIRKRCPNWRWKEWDKAIADWDRYSAIAIRSEYLEDSKRAESAKARVLNLLDDLDLLVAIQGPTSLVNSAYSTWSEDTSKAISDTHLGGFLERNSPGGGGRPRGKVKLSKFEDEAIDLYCNGVKLSEIEAKMRGQKGTVRGKGDAKTGWVEGSADLVIKAAKGRKEIV